MITAAELLTVPTPVSAWLLPKADREQVVYQMDRAEGSQCISNAALCCVAGLLTIGMCRAAKRGEQDEVHP